MKQEKTKSKKRFIYYLILGICVLLLIAATVLTVYFVTTGGNDVVENPPLDNPENPGGPDDPSNPGDDNPPASGDVVTFVSPVEDSVITTGHLVMFENVTMKSWYYFHTGIDYAAEAGASVNCIADGTVSYVNKHDNLGNIIVVDHADGFQSYYLFCEPVSGLKKGDKVTQGQKIAQVAEAYGYEEFLGPHLHFEMKLNGKYVDPTDYLDTVLEEK